MKNSGLICLISILIIHIVAYFLAQNSYPELNADFLIKEIGYSAVILSLGTLIMYLKFREGQFVSRFMIITVFQMLAILSFILALVYLKVKPLQTHGILFILTYLSGMAVQTIFFLTFSKKTS
jgi:hypothetical protein|tara:strand:- start:392 stop:760 length:369 start_codon:yes stop_codon:yes gene_type:complete